MIDGPPHWVKVTPAQLARARELVANRRAAWIDPRDYPTQASVVLQLHYRVPKGYLRGRVYIDRLGQVFGVHWNLGFEGSWTAAKARKHPTLLLHGDYELRPEAHISGAPMGWAWVHRDYDGPPDTRCGWSPTLAEARRGINALIREAKQED